MDKKNKDKFIAIVRQQAGLYKELKEVIVEEQKVLDAKNIEKLDDIVRKEEAFIEKIGKLENEKNTVFIEMIKKAGLEKTDGIKRTDVLLKEGKEDAEEVEKAVTELINALKEIEDINAKNTRVLKNYVNYLEFTKKIKEKIEKPVQTIYTSQGEKKTGEVKEKPNIDTTI